MSSKQCKSCTKDFKISEQELDLLKQMSPKFGSVQIELPSPTQCPQCRQRQRLAFRNARSLYRRTCDATGENIISILSPDKKYKAYKSDSWWGDSWDPESFGKAYNKDQPFFEQLANLRLEVPISALTLTQCENSDFNHNLGNSRNCYLTFSSSNCEDTYYSSGSINLKDCIDVWWSKTIELSAYIFCADALFDCIYCDRVGTSNNMIFCRDCSRCNNCFGCSNLVEKEYHIFNVPYEKEEYLKTIESFNRGSYKQVEKLKKQVEEFFLSQPYEATSTDFVENCSGDNIYDSKDSHHCFSTVGSENCVYSYECGRNVHCLDIDNCYDNTGNIYNSVNAHSNFNCAFLEGSHNCTDSYYLMECHNLSNCFGCVGLRNKEYCVLNRQYSKEDYERLVPIIIKVMKQRNEWGEYFDPSVSPFGYNETEANAHHPLREAKAKSLGFKWSSYAKPRPDTSKAIKASELPDHINDAGEDILKSVIICEKTGEPYRITSPELKFYKRLQIPLPRRHPDQRYQDLVEKRNPYILWDRKCNNCSIDIPSTFAPEREETIYCKECYRGEFV